ncbi:hypothetical protein ACNOYE_02750 [Nannocystaceae bacterium ST9]
MIPSGPSEPESSPSVADATEAERARAELYALRGAERVLWSEPGGQPGSLGVETDDGASAWLALLAAMTTRMSDELELGRPHLLTITYANRMVAMAIDPEGARIAVITSEPASVGLAMVKLRNWLATRSRSAA